MRRMIEDAKKGDRSACDRIVRQFSGMAFAVAYDRLRDYHLAEDAVQESFAEAFAHLSGLREAEAFPGWLKTIVERQCTRMLRRKRHPTVPIQAIGNVAGEQESPDTAAEKREMRQRLHECVAGLSPGMRLAVDLFYFQGYTVKEISSYLGVSAAALKKRLFDARHKLKRSLPVADFLSAFSELYEGGTSMLHIVNGDVVADMLKQGTVQGDILVWREVYPFGPVYPDMAEEGNRNARAEYLELHLGIPRDEFARIGESQEKALQDFRKYKEVVLWFEHDLFDQTMLAHLLHWFARQELGGTTLSMLSIGAYPGIELFRGLGQLTPKQLEALSGTWQPIGRRELELGRKLWEAYASPEPEKHIAFLGEDMSALPFARDAFEAHLSRLPSAWNGLGIVEQTTLEFAAGGARSPRELFRQVGDKLNALGMGDLEYGYRLSKMSEGPCALLEIRETGGRDAARTPLPDGVAALTEFGRNVLAGEADWTAAKGLDERYGGLWLQGHAIPWRWDPSRRTLVRTGKS